MAAYNMVTQDRIYMGKLATDDDLLEAFEAICEKESIHLGRIEALGAVRKARLGYYDQHRQVYEFSEIDKPLEITKLIGNISFRDNAPMVHAHVTLADADGNAFGGHLAPGTVVFACEFVIEAFEGLPYVRVRDEVTGLPLWDL